MADQTTSNGSSKNYMGAFALLTSLFFLWGFITVLVDSLIPRIKELFTLNYFQAGLVQFAFFMAYFLLSIPAGFLLKRIGYKKGIVVGLLTMSFGCFLFYPAADFRSFGIFLMAYFVLAGGMTVLQVAANPFVTALGKPESAATRLNLAQALNSLGTFLAPMVGAAYLLSDTIKTEEEIAALSETDKMAYLIQEAGAVQSPFLVLTAAIVGLALVFAFVKLPNLIQNDSTSGYGEALKNKTLRLGALGIFVYVGAEVAIGSYLVNYFISMDLHTVLVEMNDSFQGMDKKAIVASFVAFYWGGAMVGRFIGAVLTWFFKPGKVLACFAFGALLMILISMNTVGLVSMWSILAVGLFNSIMFPTIFTLSIEGMGDLKPQASGILCTMIVGGAIVPPLYGFLTDMAGFKMAFVLLLLCYGYILFFGYKADATPKEA